MLLYFLIDVLLLFGGIGLYGFQRFEVGLLGTLGVLLETIGALVLIARDTGVVGGSAYPAGALAFASGLDLMAIGSWKARTISRFLLVLLVLSTILGPIGFFAERLRGLFVVSGLLLGVGFAGTSATVLAGRKENYAKRS